MTKRAVIVGAGVGGLCTAIGLHRHGWDVVVLERWPKIVGIGAGLGIWPDAQLALDDLGVGAPVRDVGVKVGDAALFTSSGRRLATVSMQRIERRGGAAPRIVPRSVLVEALAGRAIDVADLRTGSAAADHADLLAAADLVVGADGLRSAVRETYFRDDARPTFTGFVAWRGSVDFELDPSAYGETWGERALVGLTPLAPGRTNWYAAALAPRDGHDDADQLTQRFGAWRSPIPDVLAAAKPDLVLRHPIEDLRPHLRRYVTNRAALVGDAAHAMTPNLGRGGCEAILDAAALVAEVGDGRDVPAALDRYDQARRRPTQRMVARSRFALRLSTARRTAVRNGLIAAAGRVLR